MLRGRRAEPLNEGAQRSNSAEMAVINPKLTLELNQTSQITNSLCSVDCISKSPCWFTNPAKWLAQAAWASKIGMETNSPGVSGLRSMMHSGN
jgi:hypothetical protein